MRVQYIKPGYTTITGVHMGYFRNKSEGNYSIIPFLLPCILHFESLLPLVGWGWAGEVEVGAS